MQMRSFLTLLILLVVLGLTPCVYADSGPVSMNSQYNYSSAHDNVKRGWWLYWPAEALAQPRLPMPYPWWPNQQAAPPIPPSEQATPPRDRPAQATPPPALFLPRDPQSLPALPGPTGWAPHPQSFQPVSCTTPGYWFPR